MGNSILRLVFVLTKGFTELNNLDSRGIRTRIVGVLKGEHTDYLTIPTARQQTLLGQTQKSLRSCLIIVPDNLPFSGSKKRKLFS